MKINEVTDTKMPHLYLDMDGVQADFFGAWADRLGVDHWKAITDKEKEINMLAHSSAKEVYDFFRNLKPLKSGLEIIAWLKQNKIPFTVLSAPLRGPFADASKKAKRDWLDQYNPGTSNNAIFTSAKYKYAKNGDTANVLVDDFGPYIQHWTNAGGIPVKHDEEFENQNTGQDTIEKLQKIYSKYLTK